VFITRAERCYDAPPEFADLAKIALGSYMLELTDALTTEEAEAAAAYDVLASALRVLASTTARVGLRQAFELKILQAAGYGLEFGCCRLCSRSTRNDGSYVYFVPSRGGIVCGQCRGQGLESAVRMDQSNALALARLSLTPVADAASTPDGGNEGSLAIGRFLTTILDRKLRSIDFLNSIL
jgi:DNA repair protein RecO (recombination protein O)